MNIGSSLKKMMSEKQPAVFLDRDGTINEDVGILADAEQLHLLPGAIDALKLLQDQYALFVVTNQQGVSEGQLTMEQVDDVHRALDDMLRAAGVHIRGWYTCPHTKDMQCGCRKPAPGLLVQAACEHPLDLRASYMIGDHPHDTETGEQLGVTGLYVLTGHGRKHRHQLPEGKPVFESILEAAKWIVAASN